MTDWPTDWTWSLDAIDKFDEGFEVVKIYDDGSGHTNEVALVRLADGQEVVTKVLLVRMRYQQRLKSLMEMTVSGVDEQLGDNGRVVMPMHARLFVPSDRYDSVFGPEQPERPRVAHLIWKHAPGIDGEKYWQTVGSDYLKGQIVDHPDTERIALIDLLVINQDRALKNWVTNNGQRFYAIDNGMAWYNEQPYFFNAYIWGCGVKCLIQERGWQPIAGVFSTLWAGRPIRKELLDALQTFDPILFNRVVDYWAQQLGFPEPIAEDFRFEGILRRIEWFAEAGRFPTRDEYYSWRPQPGHGDGSPLMNVNLMLEDGAKAIWRPDWEYLGGDPEKKTQWEIDRAGVRTEWPY